MPASRFQISAASNERLIALCQRVGCETYLAGGGAQDYQQDGLFDAAGIAVQYQSFQHPTYPQRGTQSFIAGLSVIDALMNCGVQATRRLVSAGPA